MKLNSLRFPEDVSQKLESLKRATGITPNLLCRIGFSMSLNDPTIPNPADYPADSERIIERHVLLGHWEPLFEALIRERCKQDNLPLDEETLGEQFKAHMNRGVLLLAKRVKSLGDLKFLMPREIYEATQFEMKMKEEASDVEQGHLSGS